MKGLKSHLQYCVFLLLILFARLSAFAQITPSQDAYINTATAATNYGTAATLGIVSSASSIQTTYVKFDLSSVPSGYTSANVAKATLKLYVNSVTTAGSFNVDVVNGTWSEKTITADLLPALGTTVKGSVPLTTANANTYLMIDLTATVGQWLSGSLANDGIALVPNSPLSATFQSKENTSQSHPAELDVVFTNGATLKGVTTATGSGLTGGGTTGTLSLSLTKSCTTNQVLQWNGSAWVCAAMSTGGGTGTITGVKAGTDLTGGGTTGAVTLNLDTTKVPLLAAANTFTGNQSVTGNLSATGTLVGTNAFVSNPTPAATAIYGLASATTGEGWGVEGLTDSIDPSAYGVYGLATAATGSAAGVYGQAESSNGIGVRGQVQSLSQIATTIDACCAGVWGDGGTAGDAGVLGTADQGRAGVFWNNSDIDFTLYAVAANPNGIPFVAADSTGNSYCSVNAKGDLSCTGTKNAVVPLDGGKRRVAMSAIESPVNWFEDAGSAQLVNGAAVVQLDSDFTQTVNTGMDYKVFPVPNGDCKGLYVTNKTATSFEVRELGGGTSSVRFDYRIMALRKNYENVRFADHTNDPDPSKMLASMHKAGGAGPSHAASSKTAMRLALPTAVQPTKAK